MAAAAAAAGAGAGASSKHHAASSATVAAAELPTDASAIRNILKTMGVDAHEPRVVSMLLDFMYSYVSGVLSDAAAFSEQVGRAAGEVENDDITLAIATRARHSFVPRPPQEGMRQIAEQVNAQRLPDLDTSLGYGLRLADEKHLLVQPNWRINLDQQDHKQQAQQPQQPQDGGGHAAGGAGQR